MKRVFCRNLTNFPHVERGKSGVFTADRSALLLLLTCKLINVYAYCVQKAVTVGLTSPVHIAIERNSVITLLK